MSLKDRVKPLRDNISYVNMLIYAESGAGKTVLAGSDDSVLFAAPEDSGTISAQRMGSKADKYTISRWEDLMQLYADLQELVEEGEAIPYQWICIDSVTEMQKMCMNYILQEVVKISPDRDPDIPAIQDWQRYYILFEKMIRAFNDLPVNMLYTALARKVEDADGHEFMVPEIQGKDYGIAMKVVSYMTCFGYLKSEISKLERDNGDGTKSKVNVRKRVIYFEDNGVYRGKDRTLTLGQKLELKPKNALKEIRNLIQGYNTEGVRTRPARLRRERMPAIVEPPTELEQSSNRTDKNDDLTDIPSNPAVEA